MKRTLALAIVVAMGSAAHASPPSLTPSAPQVQRIHHWYGHQTILVDLLSVGVIGTSVVSGSPTQAVIGLAGLWLGGPAVHLAHGESDRAVASFFLRPGLAVGGALAGAKLEDCGSGEEWCGLAGGFAGAVLGLGAATVIDAGWSYEVTVAPIVQPRGESYGLGLTGSF